MNANSENQVIVDLTTVSQEVRTVGENPLMVVPKDFAVVDLEKFLPHPTRYRGVFSAQDVASFIAYFNKHKQIASNVYGTLEPPFFKGVLNDNAESEGPAWGDFGVTYACKHSKEWLAWDAKDGDAMPQVEFAYFIETNLPDIYSSGEGEPTGAEMLAIAGSFQAHTKVNFMSGQRLDNGQTELVYQEEITSGAGPKGSIKIPPAFFIAIPVFEGSDPYKVEAKFRYRIKEGKLAMWYELVRPHKSVEKAFDDIWSRIATETERTIFKGVR